MFSFLSMFVYSRKIRGVAEMLYYSSSTGFQESSHCPSKKNKSSKNERKRNKTQEDTDFPITIWLSQFRHLPSLARHMFKRDVKSSATTPYFQLF